MKNFLLTILSIVWVVLGVITIVMWFYLFFALLEWAFSDPFNLIDSKTCTVDRTLETHLFDSCLSKIPKWPDSTVYNDWSEVVKQCRDSASQRAYSCK